MSDLRRYEILVPLLFNDGRRVPEPLLARVCRAEERFGAALGRRCRATYRARYLIFREFKQKLKALRVFGSPRIPWT